MALASCYTVDAVGIMFVYQVNKHPCFGGVTDKCSAQIEDKNCQDMFLQINIMYFLPY